MREPLGLESGVVRLVDYDERWPVLFAAERTRLLRASAPLAVRFEHIGGTAIPGMCAKPVLDMLAGRPAGGGLDDYVSVLQAAGYEHHGEAGVQGRAYFRRGEPRAYHLHLVEDEGPLWRQYLAFRDYLRTHPATAREFAALKRALAAQFATDRKAYVASKGPHVAHILALARPAVESW